MSAKNDAQKNDFIALKNVLFGRESAVLDDIRAVVQSHDQKIGTPEQLSDSVADILSGALRGAGIKNRPALASSLAPLIIDGIRSEIRNSRDDIVEALYPIIGRLTSAYVMSVFRDFMDETNKRLEGSLTGRFLWLRLYCLFTGKSYAQALLQRQTSFRIQEIMLIDAQSGSLLDSWEAPDLALDREAMADKGPRVTAMLAAINKFAAEALSAKHQSLKSIDLGDSQIYLRMTAKFLFAVRCQGLAKAGQVSALDRTIVDVLQLYEPGLNSMDRHTAKQSASASLAALAENVQDTLRTKRSRPVLAIAFFAGLFTLFLGYVVWSSWQAAKLEAIRSRAETVATGISGAATYPIEVTLDGDKRALTLSGIVPSQAMRDEMQERVAQETAGMALRNHLLVMPDARTVDALQTAVTALTEKLNEIGAKVDAANANAAELKASLGVVTADLFSPQQRFNSWARNNAIFFGEGTNFQKPEMARRQLDELAAQLRDSDLRILIIGHTDTLGGKEKNLQLGMERAKAVSQELIRLGIAPDRLALVSRPGDTVLVTNETGVGSANRRVEFQLDFIRR